MRKRFDCQVTVESRNVMVYSHLDSVESKQPQQTSADLEPQPDSLDDQVDKIVDVYDVDPEMNVGRYHREWVVPFVPSGRPGRVISTLPSFPRRHIERRIPTSPITLPSQASLRVRSNTRTLQTPPSSTF